MSESRPVTMDDLRRALEAALEYMEAQGGDSCAHELDLLRRALSVWGKG